MLVCLFCLFVRSFVRGGFFFGLLACLLASFLPSFQKRRGERLLERGGGDLCNGVGRRGESKLTVFSIRCLGSSLPRRNGIC